MGKWTDQHCNETSWEAAHLRDSLFAMSPSVTHCLIDANSYLFGIIAVLASMSEPLNVVRDAGTLPLIFETNPISPLLSGVVFGWIHGLGFSEQVGSCRK